MEFIKPSQTRLFRSRANLETPMTQSPDIPAACPPECTTDALFSALYDELRRLARQRMARERGGDTHQATSLVNEVWLRLSQLRQQSWRDEAHFIAAASETMRRILVDRARRRQARKHGGELRRTQAALESLAAPQAEAPDHLILDDHLERFAQAHPDKARLLELRFFAGLTMPEIAALTGLSEKTVQRHWAYARVWLYESIQREREARPEG
ncbi:MAG: sigma-70 family RNA polymerase sigma factor [Verrucomicrobiales bacterium]|nr:sigma-70 family RNA polymerase sigma factor [Verrucomicrobiales bacterium]